MKGEGQIRDGLLFLNKALHDYVLKNEEADCLVEIQVIKTPEHYLYKYLFGFLFKDMAEHAGYSVEDIKEEMKDRYAKYKVETWEDVPKHHRSKCQRYEREVLIYNEDGSKAEKIERWYTKSLSSMYHDELIEFVKNVEFIFLDFLGGGFNGDKETQFTMHKFRQMGMMSKEELKKFKKEKGVED